MKLLNLLFIFFTISVASLSAQNSYNANINSPASLAGKLGNSRADWTNNVLPFGQTVTANLAIVNSGISPTNDSINAQGCDTLINVAQISGKIALIRRGVCQFGFKALMAQNAGAVAVIIVNVSTVDNPTNGGEPFNPAEGTDGASVTIPVLMVSNSVGQDIIAAVKSGVAVNVTINRPPFFNQTGPFAYVTPLSQADTMGFISVRIANPTPNAQTNITATAIITDPQGIKTLLTATLPVLPSLADSAVVFPATYKPSKKGLHKIEYLSSTFPNDTLRTEFKIGDYTFALDGGITSNAGIGPAAATFQTALYRYDAGSLYRTGTTAGVAVGATFGIANIKDIPVGETFQIRVYDMDPTGIGNIAFSATNLTYDGYTLEGGIDLVTTSQDTVNNKLFNVTFDQPIPLKPRGEYLVVVKYDGAVNGSTVAPSFSAGKTLSFPYTNSETHIVILDRMYTGFAGSSNAIVRMNMQGFVTANEEVVKAETLKMTVQPNPATNFVAVSYELQTAGNVELTLFNVNGQAVKSLKESNRMDAGLHTASFDVSDLAKGVYFVKINNNNKVAVKKVVVQ